MKHLQIVVVGHGHRRAVAKARLSSPGMVSSSEEGLRKVAEKHPVLMDIFVKDQIDRVEAAKQIRYVQSSSRSPLNDRSTPWTKHEY